MSRNLTDSEIRALSEFDSVLVPIRTMAPGDRVSHTFVYEDYEDMEQYAAELRKFYGDRQAHLHELAHGRTALAVGATSIRYSIEYRHYFDWGERAGERCAERGVTRILSNEKIPMLARLAINAAPIDPSLSDIAPIRRFYGSMDFFSERVARWNDEHSLFIPPPGSLDDRR